MISELYSTVPPLVAVGGKMSSTEWMQLPNGLFEVEQRPCCQQDMTTASSLHQLSSPHGEDHLRKRRIAVPGLEGQVLLLEKQLHTRNKQQKTDLVVFFISSTSTVPLTCNISCKDDML